MAVTAYDRLRREKRLEGGHRKQNMPWLVLRTRGIHDPPRCDACRAWMMLKRP